MRHHAVMNICPTANINYVGPEFARIDGRANVAIKADPNPHVQQMATEAHVYDGHGEKWIACNIAAESLKLTDAVTHT